MLLRQLWILCSFLIIGWAVSYYISQMISSPIRKLAHNARQIADEGPQNLFTILGDDEIKKGIVLVRNLDNGEQQEIAFDMVLETLVPER